MRGGCTPVGMKKQFPNYIDETAQLFDFHPYLWWKTRTQFNASPEDLASFVSATLADIVREVQLVAYRFQTYATFSRVF